MMRLMRLIRTLKQKAPKENGIHRMYWDLSERKVLETAIHAGLCQKKCSRTTWCLWYYPVIIK